MFTEEFEQLKKNIPLILKIVGLGILILIIIVLIHYSYDIKISDLTRDPAAIMNSPPYIGALSTLGVLLWASSSSISIFASIIKKGIYSKLLLYSGLLTLMLLLDDVYMLHEYFFPNVIGISEKIVFLGYALIIVLILKNNKDIIVKTDYPILVVALGFFGMSLIVDNIRENILPAHHIFEDGFKFIGIMLWATYFIKTSFNSIREKELTNS